MNMKDKLKNRVAIVTGASKGIGAGIAKELAAQGAAIIVNYAGSHDSADKVVADIISDGGKAVAVQADISKSADVKRLFDAAKNEFGGVDIVVNNAGVFSFGPVETVTETEFHRQFNTNVLGPILTTQESLKYFPESGGCIINISSIASQNPNPNASLYASTKGAIDALTISWSKELAPRNIRVNSVAPGNTETEGAHSLGIFGTDIEKAMIASTPLKRFGQPKDIAAVVAFLASDDAGWVTGERIKASGGLN
jgi:3-oxoacyl-[acyl-carrier protein] reductase